MNNVNKTLYIFLYVEKLMLVKKHWYYVNKSDWLNVRN